MSAINLHNIEMQIDQLDAEEKVRLLQYLLPRIGGQAPASGDIDAAWQRFRALGDRLAATSVPGAASLTDAVSQMRR